MKQFYAALLIAISLVAFSAWPSAEEDTVRMLKLIDAQSATSATASITQGYMSRCRETAIYVGWGTGVSSGAVKVETAVDASYAGTWAPLATVTYVSGAPSQDVVQITGVHWAIRTRISTTVAGGTATTWAVCN